MESSSCNGVCHWFLKSLLLLLNTVFQLVDECKKPEKQSDVGAVFHPWRLQGWALNLKHKQHKREKKQSASKREDTETTMQLHFSRCRLLLSVFSSRSLPHSEKEYFLLLNHCFCSTPDSRSFLLCRVMSGILVKLEILDPKGTRSLYCFTVVCWNVWMSDEEGDCAGLTQRWFWSESGGFGRVRLDL